MLTGESLFRQAQFIAAVDSGPQTHTSRNIQENRRLKQMYADLSPNHEAPKYFVQKEFYSTYALVARIRSINTNADPAASPVILRRKEEAFLMKIWSRSRLTKYLYKGKDPGC